MDFIAASNDRVVVHQAIKHLVVGGNALIFMGKDGLKNFPLNRYVIERDGNGNVIEIVTKELISKDLMEPRSSVKMILSVKSTTVMSVDDVEKSTLMSSRQQRWVWHQELNDKIIPGRRSTAPKNASPWLVLRGSTPLTVRTTVVVE